MERLSTYPSARASAERRKISASQLRGSNILTLNASQKYYLGQWNPLLLQGIMAVPLLICGPDGKTRRET